MIEQWIDDTRADAAFHDCSYKVISRIKLDNAGEWDRKCGDWKELMRAKGVDCVYSCPEREESAAHAERSCGIAEVVVKSMLMQANLPPSWWECAANMAEWVLDRFPTTSQSMSVPMDGDHARPLELYTQGAYSRRQIDRELSYCVGLVHPAWYKQKPKVVHSSRRRGGESLLVCTWNSACFTAHTPNAISDPNHLQRLGCGGV